MIFLLFPMTLSSNNTISLQSDPSGVSEQIQHIQSTLDNANAILKNLKSTLDRMEQRIHKLET